jgi:hypothetical protein
MKVQQLHLGLPAQPSEATPEALPMILRAPPWRQPRPAPLPAAGLTLSIPDSPCTVLWAPGERIRHLRPARPHSGHQQRLEAALRDGVGQLWMLEHLEDTAALRVWNTAPPESWERHSTADMLALLARLEGAALPGLLAAAERDLSVVAALSRLGTPTIAPLMATALCSRSARDIAHRWLLMDPTRSALGLIPAATGADSRAALLALRLLEQRGCRRIIQNAAASYGPAASTWIGRWLARSPLLDVPARRPKMPDFWRPEDLQRPALADGSPLPLSAVQHLGELLCFTPVSPAYAGLSQIRDACCPDSLDAFVVDVFSAWEDAGCPPQHDWPLWALGHLGGDGAVRHLAGRIRSWPGQGGASRAGNALQVLAMIDTPIARLYLHHIAQTTRYTALRQSAWDTLSGLALQHGIPLSDLLDRDHPWLGLDAQGRRTLDFGTRRFRIAFGADLQPRVRDQRGRSLRALPRPGRRDVQRRAEEAWRIWRDLRQDVRVLVATWSRRMERLMCSGRLLPMESFHSLLAHPILGHCAAGLIWSVVTPAGDRLLCFRIAEDFTLAGLSGEPVLLPRQASVSIPHRLHLADEEAAAWLSLLDDAGITQPFLQLRRPTFTPTPDEHSATRIIRLMDRVAQAGRIMALLSRGWQWGEATEAGFTSCVRPIPGAHCAAVLPLSPGIPHSAPGEQRLGPLLLQHADASPLLPARLSPLVFSELLCDLHGLLEESG